jgi:hypothetical protein
MRAPEGKQGGRKKKATISMPPPKREGTGAIVFTRHDDSNDIARAHQKSMVEEHRQKLQRAKEEVASSKLAILLPHVREALLRETLCRSDWVVDKALVLLEGFLAVHEDELKALEKKIDDRKRAVLEEHGMDTDLLLRERKERKKSRSQRERRQEKERRREKKERRRKDREGGRRVDGGRELEERMVFDDEAERRKELLTEREREKDARLVDAYRELQGGKAVEMREQALLKERLQVAYRTGNTDEVERLKERLKPSKDLR